MKQTLLFTLLFAFSFVGFSQILHSNDFNGLTLGDFGATIDGTALGQGGFGLFGSNGTAPTTTNNAAPSNFQVVTTGNNGTQGAQITSPNGDAGTSLIFKDITTEWAGRTAGNDIIEFETSFFTGSATTSLAPFRLALITIDGTTLRTAVAMEYNPQNRELIGLANLINGGPVGFFAFDIGAGNTALILDADTWYELGISYDKTTGLIRWKVSLNGTSVTNVLFSAAANVITGMDADRLDFRSFGTPADAGPPAVPANTSSTNYVFDDYQSRASATDNLLSINETALEVVGVSLFPNPADDVITLSTTATVKEVSIYNTLGQAVLTKSNNFSASTDIDISTLKTGIYIMNIKSDDNRIQTQRFIKN